MVGWDELFNGFLRELAKDGKTIGKSTTSISAHDKKLTVQRTGFPKDDKPYTITATYERKSGGPGMNGEFMIATVMSEHILFAARSNACTWPTASAEMLAETERVVINAQAGTMWDRWPAARRRIENNNRIRDEISRISGLRNRAVASFENGEPLVEGF